MDGVVEENEGEIRGDDDDDEEGGELYNIYIVSRAVFIRDNAHRVLFPRNRKVARTVNNTI